jgi:hypothetical protein
MTTTANAPPEAPSEPPPLKTCSIAPLSLLQYLARACTGLAYYAKLAIHPTQLTALSDLWARAAVGPIRGEMVVAAGVVFHLGWMAFAAVTLRLDQRSWSQRQSLIAIG